MQVEGFFQDCFFSGVGLIDARCWTLYLSRLAGYTVAADGARILLEPVCNPITLHQLDRLSAICFFLW